MTTRNINKQLAAMEDLAQGIGTTNQVRGGIARTVHRIDVPVAVETQEDMEALDVEKFTRARVYSTATSFTDYIYDVNATSGITSIGPGFWVPSLKKTVKTEFDTVEEAVNYNNVASIEDERVYIQSRGIYFKVVLTSTLEGNDLDRLQSVYDSTYSFVDVKQLAQVVQENFSVTSDSTFRLNSNLVNSSINIEGVKSNTTLASDVARGDDTITVNVTNFDIGDAVLVEGTINHEDYSPSRYDTLKLVAEVIDVSGLNIVLDIKIEYILTAVTVSKIPKIDVDINADLIDSTISLTNVRNVKFKGTCFGDVGIDSGQSFLNISSAKYTDIEIAFHNAACVLGLVNNNVSSGVVTLNSINSGGQSLTATSKMYRANAIQNMTINGNFIKSRHADSTIYAARNVVCNYLSYGGGANFFDSGSTTSNRLESVQFSECDNTTINGHMVESNDQCVEMLACTESYINGNYSNSKSTESTEGAVVVKGAGRDVTVNAVVNGYNSRGVKFELTDGGYGFKTSPNSDIRSDSTEALAIRDAASAYDCRCQLRGSFSGSGVTVIDVREFSDGVTVDATVNMANATNGISMASSDWNVAVHGINTQTNKQLLSIGNNAVDFNIVSLSGEQTDVYMLYNGNSRDEFRMEHLNGLKGKAEFGGASQSFTMKGGIAYSNIVPTFGVFFNGDSYKRLDYNSPAIDFTSTVGTGEVEYRVVENGRMYRDDGVNPVGWIQEFSLRAKS